MQVGIILPSYGHFQYLHLAAESAAKTPGVVVIVVDDASKDWPGDRTVRGYLPNDVPFVIQRYDGNAGLSRSWNAGLRICRNMGLPYAVCGNSDLVFSMGWWEHLEAALQSHDFAGPVTNSPGHVRQQNVTRYIPGYVASDDPDDIEDTAKALRGAGHTVGVRSNLNGFCIAGKTDSFHRAGNFNPSIPLAGNEDDLFKRSAALGMTCAVVPQSFVFHYRSVTRGDKFAGGQPVRLAGCTGCGSAK